ncbi:MAG TPA: tetratricopeptide repeat protein [Pirellulales bacterium]|nr:tetratricopeptide repeat protein [Pirellulales bacterium]
MKLARRAAAYGGACGYGAGYGCGYGGGGYGRGYGDGCGSCGGGYGGCGSGGCADGGCAGGDCVGGSSSGVPINGTTPSGNGEVIYDGPVPPPVPAPADNSSAFMVTRRPFQLASNQTQERDGSAAFERGVSLFRSKSYTDAISAFDGALAAEPKNALYQYYRAMSLFEVHGADAANGDLQQAVQLEREQPVSNWGKRMERVQGRSRVWVESARRAAL